jgi:uncharacterized protein YhfF
VVTTWSGEPACLIETLEAHVQPFEPIDVQFAWDHGASSRSLTRRRSQAARDLGQTGAHPARWCSIRMGG